MCEVVDLEEWRIKRRREKQETEEIEEREQEQYVRDILDAIIKEFSSRSIFFDSSEPEQVESITIETDDDS